MKIGEVINLAVARGLASARVCFPARVESYDLAANRASVTPLLPVVEVDGEGARTMLTPQPINGVPVAFLRGGGFSEVHPLKPGDRVTVLITDRSLDAYLSNGELLDPSDDRAHDLNDAVALAMDFADFSHPPPHLREDCASIGAELPADSTAPLEQALRLYFFAERIALGAPSPAYSAALAEKVFDELKKIRDTLDALVTKFNGHGHAVSVSVTTTGSATNQAGGGAGATTSLTPGPAAAPAGVSAVGSSVVKVRE